MRTLFKEVPEGSICFNKNSTGTDIFRIETNKF